MPVPTVVIGCLLLIILPLIGFVVGAYFGDVAIGLWAAAGGFGLAVLVCSISVTALVKSRPS